MWKRKKLAVVLHAIDDVFANAAGEKNAFVVTRPPGHHASSSSSSGFCLFNNVAIAARYAMERYDVRRVLILDWDVHHGNGTQEIFYQDRNVLYMSLHRHDGGGFYPMGEPKDFSDVGEEDGVGFSVNVPFSSAKMGDLEYRAAFMKVIMPIAYEFNPELVLISSGFDAAAGDPLGEYKVSPETFALMTYELCGLAGGRTIAVLEGGYNLTAIAESAQAVVETLLHRAVVRKLVSAREQFATKKPQLHPEAWTSLRKVCHKQESYWSCLMGFQRLIGESSGSTLLDRKGRPTPTSTPKSEKTSTSSSKKLLPTPPSTTPRRSPRIAASQKKTEKTDMQKLEEEMARLMNPK
ncbi:unnamed protein product [Caenorhabditis auriculariae]|uniref:Histone deacetylase domain-containing protein n=1 Tax=Caenorhabditis auriculariae TaxID=2777116 RepID=A0A8S1H711_9PELO|nr:unnamed protein product [Caenorhabditis auriculariae]